MKGGNVTIANTPTLVFDGSQGTATVPASAVIFLPSGSVDVFFGGPDVAATDAGGFRRTTGTSFAIDLVSDKLYAIVASGTQVVAVLRDGS